ncbi:MAG TPA: hypothetical protein VMD92_10955 [Acidobacteriaceae bacterium]|nr:hypothetical protein [Acidobacteriaceae bacterium]
MRLNVGLKYLALGVATGLLGFSGSAFAQSGAQNWQLVGVNARLDRTINSDSVKQGQAVEAKLDGTITSNGVKIEKGTELLGTVADAAPSANRGPASLTLLFTKAQLKDGKQIPVKVTLLAAYPSSAGEDATYGDSIVPPAPRHVNAEQKIDQEPGMLGHVALKGSVQGQNSGTFWKTDGNFQLKAGTFLQVGIAPASGSRGTASGV